jgi:succinate dehydrogenase / fumarate reductase membrane anchor subunit
VSAGKQSSMRTPLASARGLGSSRTGTEHFWYQRLTSVALVPLTIAFVFIVVTLVGRNHAATVQILGTPLVAITMLLFILATAYHMWVGTMEIIIDYVHDELWKYLALMANTFFSFIIAFAAAFAILKLSLQFGA